MVVHLPPNFACRFHLPSHDDGRQAPRDGGQAQAKAAATSAQGGGKDAGHEDVGWDQIDGNQDLKQKRPNVTKMLEIKTWKSGRKLESDYEAVSGSLTFLRWKPRPEAFLVIYIIF